MIQNILIGIVGMLISLNLQGSQQQQQKPTQAQASSEQKAEQTAGGENVASFDDVLLDLSALKPEYQQSQLKVPKSDNPLEFLLYSILKQEEADPGYIKRNPEIIKKMEAFLKDRKDTEKKADELNAKKS